MYTKGKPSIAYRTIYFYSLIHFLLSSKEIINRLNCMLRLEKSLKLQNNIDFLAVSQIDHNIPTWLKTRFYNKKQSIISLFI